MIHNLKVTNFDEIRRSFVVLRSIDCIIFIVINVCFVYNRDSSDNVAKQSYYKLSPIFTNSYFELLFGRLYKFIF